MKRNVLIMQNRIWPTMLILMLLVFSRVEAQSSESRTFSLAEAREYAIQHNYDVRNSAYDVEAARKQVREITAGGFPQISASVEYNDFLDIPTQLIPGEIFGGDPGSTIAAQFGQQHTATASITANQLIFNGSYIVGIQASQIVVRLMRENLERSQIDVKELVTQTYYLILVAEENHQILKTSMDNLEKTLTEVSAMYQEGFVEETDVKQLQISVTRLKNTLNTVEKQIGITYNLLKFQMGINLNESIALSEKLDGILPRTKIPTLLERPFDVKQNVNFRLLSTQERIAQLSLRNEKSKFLPTIAAFATTQRNAQRNEFNFFSGDEDWFRTTIIGLQLNIPIFNSGAKFFKVQQSKIALKQAEINRVKGEQGLLLQHSQAKTALSSAFESYHSSYDNLNLARDVYDITREKYSEGLSSSLDLIQVHNQFLTAESEYITAMSDLFNARTYLDKLYNFRD